MMRRGMRMLACLVLTSSCFAAGGQQLQKGDYVGVIGDSITEQKKYSVFIEDYLVMCQPAQDLTATQFGWSGETSWGYAARMANDTFRFHPTAATTVYGMNDGLYAPPNPQVLQRYRENQTKIVRALKEQGAHLIVVGSPGCVDVATFRNHNRQAAEMYNKTLADERDIAREVAQKEGVEFADVFDAMHSAMLAAEEKYGPGYRVCGGDGVHPDDNGHLIMAYALLKALGCRGEIGTITVDLADGKAQATDGHKILSCSNGVVEVESTRYPFCFFGDNPKDPRSTRGILPFVPFNQDLNRFMLVVHGAKGDHVKVTWGDQSKEFTAEQLAKGINLAAEFLDNPFVEPFRRIDEQVRHKQDMETPLVKEVINQAPRVEQSDPSEKQPLETAIDAGIKCDKDLSTSLTAAVRPVKHAIRIEDGQ